MRSQALLIVGATGLIGQLAMRRLLAEETGPQVIAISRRALLAEHPRLVSITANMSDPAEDIRLIERLRELCTDTPHSFLCALGTTQREAGSTSAFRAIDLELVVRLASVALNLGACQAIVVSSVGADAQSNNVYLKTKGEMEQQVGELGFDRCDFLRPALLLGERKGRYRLAEHVGQLLSPVYNPLLTGSQRRYRTIPGHTVAAALIALAGRQSPGRYIHEHDALQQLATQMNAETL